MRIFLLGILFGAVAAIVLTKRRRRGYGSLTSASDAVDDIELNSDPSPDELLDAAVKGTFPASDPIAVHRALEKARLL